MEASHVLQPERVDLRLQPKQAIAFQTEATEVLYGGAKYGGKSHLMRAAMIYWCCKIPGLQCYLFRRIGPDLWRNHMTGPGSFFSLLLPLMQDGYASFSGRGSWLFWNGSRIHLCHCQHDTDMNNYQGAEMHVLGIDQLEQWPKAVYVFLRAQVRLGGLQLPPQFVGKFPRVLNSANPGGIGHNWIKSEFVDIAPEFAITQMPADKGGMKRQYIPARLEDNKVGTDLDPGYEDRLKGLGSPALVKALRWGLWDIVAGGAVDDVWEPTIHIIPAFTIPKTWRVNRSLDWGSSKPYSVGWWARADGSTVILPDGRRKTFFPGTKIRLAEDYGWNGNPDEGCKRLPVEVARRILAIEETLPFKGQIRPGPADSSIFDSDSPIADDMARVGVRWTVADKRPGSRVAGLEKMRGMFLACVQIDPATRLPLRNANGLMIPKSPMEEPGLFVFDTCRHFIRTIPVLPRDDKKIDDVDTAAEDHCLHGDTLVDTDKGQFKIRELVGVEGTVRTIGGWTSFSHCRITRKDQELVRVTLDDGRSVVCTKDHRFLTAIMGWVEAENLCGLLLSTKLSKSLMGSDTTSVVTISRKKGSDYILSFGSSITDLFQKVSLFIMSKIPSITKLKNWMLGWMKTMRPIMLSEMTILNGMNPVGLGLSNGMEARKVKNGISSSMRSIVELPLKPLRWKSPVLFVKLSSEERLTQSIVQEDAGQLPEEGAYPIVKKVESAGRGDVYCLVAKETHAFSVEGGIIVHNCYDESRYAIMTPVQVASVTQASR